MDFSLIPPIYEKDVSIWKTKGNFRRDETRTQKDSIQS